MSPSERMAEWTRAWARFFETIADQQRRAAAEFGRKWREAERRAREDADRGQ
jgi:hypothetical protein